MRGGTKLCPAKAKQPLRHFNLLKSPQCKACCCRMSCWPCALRQLLTSGAPRLRGRPLPPACAADDKYEVDFVMKGGDGGSGAGDGSTVWGSSGGAGRGGGGSGGWGGGELDTTGLAVQSGTGGGRQSGSVAGRAARRGAAGMCKADGSSCSGWFSIQRRPSRPSPSSADLMPAVHLPSRRRAGACRHGERAGAARLGG